MKNKNTLLILVILVMGVVSSCSFYVDFEVTGTIIDYNSEKYSDLKIQFDFYQTSKAPASTYQQKIRSDGTFKVFGSFSNLYPDGLSFISGDTTLARFHFHEERNKFVMENLVSRNKFFAEKQDTIRFNNITVELIDEKNKLLVINFDDLFKGFHIEVQKKEMTILFSQPPPNNTSINIHATKGLKSIKHNVPVTSDTIHVNIDRFVRSSGKIQMDWIELVTPYEWSRFYSIYDFRYGSIFRN